MCLRRYSEVSKRIEEVEDSYSRCEQAEHKVQVRFRVCNNVLGLVARMPLTVRIHTVTVWSIFPEYM